MIISPSNHARTHSHSTLFNPCFYTSLLFKDYAAPTNYYAKKTIILHSLVIVFHYKKVA